MPTLDEPLRQLSDLANNSKLWLAIAGGLFVLGGRTGRRAALTGAAAIAISSAIVNLPMKFAGRRRRPDRGGIGVPERRWVEMPTSTLVPVGALRVGLRVRERGGGNAPDRGRAAARPRRGRRLLPRAHRRSLPGRRGGRLADRRDDRRGDGAGRARDPSAPSARVARATGRRGLGRLTDVLSGERKART